VKRICGIIEGLKKEGEKHRKAGFTATNQTPKTARGIAAPPLAESSITQILNFMIFLVLNQTQ
jgi:hypothetical protein